MHNHQEAGASKRLAVATAVAAVALVGSMGLALARPDVPSTPTERAAVLERPRPVLLAQSQARPATPAAALPEGNEQIAAPTKPATPPAPLAPGDTFAARFPAHHRATQDRSDPASTRWALLIGVNFHASRSVRDNIGSRQDAQDLRAHLLANGWRDDHILLLTDRDATGRNITDGLRWLADKTNPDSAVAVFNYSGHAKVARGLDDDPERIDEALWPTDDRFISDAALVDLLDGVDAQATWINFATCNAAGFADPGLARPGRVLTFSSGEAQKSYEHPDWDNSVWGYSMIEQALRQRQGDLDADGRATIEEAWTWARPFAAGTTRDQRFGPQDPVIIDGVLGDLHLGIPGIRHAGPASAPPAPSASPAPGPAPTTPPEPELSPASEMGPPGVSFASGMGPSRRQ